MHLAEAMSFTMWYTVGQHCVSQVTLEPFERDHAVVVGVFRPPPKAKAAQKAAAE